MMRLILLSASVIALSACGDRDQSASENRYLPDVHPSAGAKNAYVAPGWTQGDKTSWQNRLRERGQNQNEYVKTN